MSTVLESIAAHHLGAEVAGVSLVTNMAAGMGGELSHGEVLEVASASTERIVSLVGTLVRAA
jgi:purine-nucleoside phosphorylase